MDFIRKYLYLLLLKFFAIASVMQLVSSCSPLSGDISCKCDPVKIECIGTQTNVSEIQDILANSSTATNLVIKVTNLQFDASFKFENMTINNLTLGYDMQTPPPDFFSELGSTLVSLNLQNNSIKHIDDQLFSSLSGLTELFLDTNELDELSSSIFANLLNLKYLSLSSNNFQEVGPDTFQSLPSLNTLVLGNNKISKFANVEIKSSSLLVLKVDGCLIEGELVKDTFSELPNLEDLDLSYNLLHEIKPHSLSALKRLKHLNLSHNAIKSLDQNAFLELSSLIELDLSANEIKVVKTTAFSGLLKLKFLDLSGNKLKSIHCAYTTDFAALEIFYVRNNDMNYNDKVFTAGTFYYSPLLKELDISGHHFICSCELTDTVNYLIANSTITEHYFDSVFCVVPSTNGSMRITDFKSSECIPEEPCKKLSILDDEDYDYDYDDDNTTLITTSALPSTTVKTTTEEITTEYTTPTTQFTTSNNFNITDPITDSTTVETTTEVATPSFSHPTTDKITTTSVLHILTVTNQTSLTTAETSTEELTTINNLATSGNFTSSESNTDATTEEITTNFIASVDDSTPSKTFTSTIISSTTDESTTSVYNISTVVTFNTTVFLSTVETPIAGTTLSTAFDAESLASDNFTTIESKPDATTTESIASVQDSTTAESVTSTISNVNGSTLVEFITSTITNVSETTKSVNIPESTTIMSKDTTTITTPITEGNATTQTDVPSTTKSSSTVSNLDTTVAVLFTTTESTTALYTTTNTPTSSFKPDTTVYKIIKPSTASPEEVCSSLKLSIDTWSTDPEITVVRNFSHTDNTFCLKWSVHGVLPAKLRCTIKYKYNKGTKLENLKCPSYSNEVKLFFLNEKVFQFCIEIYTNKKLSTCTKVVDTIKTTVPTTTTSKHTELSSTTKLLTDTTTTPTTTVFTSSKTTEEVKNITTAEYTRDKTTEPAKSTTTTTTDLTTESSSLTRIDTTKSVTTFQHANTNSSTVKFIPTFGPYIFNITSIEVYFNDSSFAYVKWTVNMNEPPGLCNLTLTATTQYADHDEGNFPCSKHTFKLQNVKQDDIFKVCLVSNHRISGSKIICRYSISGANLDSAASAKDRDETNYSSSLIPLICLLVILVLIIIYIIYRNINKRRQEADRYDVRAQEEKSQRVLIREKSPNDRTSARYSYIAKENTEVI